MDEDDGGIYYAQLRGFLQDQYNDKSAVITWLIPTLESPLEGFDASSFILGKYQLICFPAVKLVIRP